MPGLIQEHTQPSAAAAGDDRGEWFFGSLPLTAGALKSRLVVPFCSQDSDNVMCIVNNYSYC